MRSGQVVGHVFVNVDHLIKACLFCDLTILLYFQGISEGVLVFDCVLFGDHVCVEGNALICRYHYL